MYANNSPTKRGFTLIEIIITTVIFVTLLGVASLNLLNSRDSASAENALNVIVNDIKSQQNQSIIGSTSGTSPSEYGVYFETNQYTLFKGSSYSPSSNTNHIIPLDPSLSFSSIGFPSGAVIFARGSGEVQNFSAGQNTITLLSTNGGESKTMRINKYGVIDSIQ